MRKTLGLIKINASTDVQDTSSNIKTLAERYANRRYNEIYERFKSILGMQFVRESYQLSATAGTSKYALPDDFGEPIKVLDYTNNIQLNEIDPQQWVDRFGLNIAEGSGINIDTSGEVREYFIIDSNVVNDPSSASVISFVSSSASDSSQIMYVKGIASGRITQEEVSLNGTTTASTTNSFTRVLSISKNADTAGIVTATSNSGAVEIANFSTDMREHRIKVIKLVRTPAQALTIQIPYVQRFLPMTNDNDYPVFDCGDQIEIGATADLLRYKKQYAKAADLDRIFEERVQDLVWSYENKPNKIHRTNPQPYPRSIVG